MPDEFTPQPDPVQPERPFSLAGRKALVVGVARPLGRAIAVALAQAGADVAVAGLTREPSEIVQVNSVANEVWSLSREQIALELDAADPSSVQAAVQRVDEAWGRIDVLVNAPDLFYAWPLTEMADAEWQSVIDANLTSVALSCREVGRVMLREGFGRVINVASVLGARGVSNTGVYAAAHGGAVSLTRALSQEWARSGVTVNAVQVGFYEGQAGPAEDGESLEQLVKVLPSRELTKPEDVAALCVMVAADGGFISGDVIAVDGGDTARV